MLNPFKKFGKKNNEQKEKQTPGAVDIKTLHKNLSFTATEQYKLLRTNLAFTIPQGEKCPVIGVTSSMRGEGKSTTAINLSYVLAENGSRVLLMDGDLRIPSVAKKLSIASKPGVTNLLMTHSSDVEVFKSSLLDNWYIVPAGDIPPNPSELLGSDRMKDLLDELKKQFDYIVVDLPPINIVADALAMAKMLTGLILVIREEYTEKKELTHCMRQLDISNVKLLGCVLNESSNGNGSYKKYNYRKHGKRGYGYYSHHYGYGYYTHHHHKDDAKSENTEEKK